MVHASKTPLLVSSKKKGGTSVRAVLLDKANLAARVSERNETLAQKFYPHWRAIGFGNF
jgi:hypothetical protein